jgi:hypothetical protein
MINKKVVPIFIIVSILIFGTVSAMTDYQQNIFNNVADFQSKILYGASKGLFIFTSWGQANDCSVNPDKERYVGAGTRIDCDDYCDDDKCAIDVWYDPTLYLNGQPSGYPNNADWAKLKWSKEYSGEGAYWKASSTHDYWYYQLYCCPIESSIEDHDTDVYRCENGGWSNKGDFDSDDSCSYDTSGVGLCWCSDEDDNFYIDNTGNVHCRGSAQSSWCPTATSHASSKCYSNNIYWYDSYGNVQELKETCTAGCVTGSSSCSSSCKTEADTNCDGTISRTELGIYITKWLNDEVSREVLGTVMQGWSGV